VELREGKKGQAVKTGRSEAEGGQEGTREGEASSVAEHERRERGEKGVSGGRSTTGAGRPEEWVDEACRAGAESEESVDQNVGRKRAVAARTPGERRAAQEQERPAVKHSGKRHQRVKGTGGKKSQKQARREVEATLRRRNSRQSNETWKTGQTTSRRGTESRRKRGVGREQNSGRPKPTQAERNLSQGETRTQRVKTNGEGRRQTTSGRPRNKTGKLQQYNEGCRAESRPPQNQAGPSTEKPKKRPTGTTSEIKEPASRATGSRRRREEKRKQAGQPRNERGKIVVADKGEHGP